MVAQPLRSRERTSCDGRGPRVPAAALPEDYGATPRVESNGATPTAGRSDVRAEGLEPSRLRATGATPVLHWRPMPTKRRRHAITETPPVQAALNDLRAALGDDRVEMSELVILGAREKLARIREEREGTAMLRRRLADRVRKRDIPADPAAADEVRRAGWARA